MNEEARVAITGMLNPQIAHLGTEELGKDLLDSIVEAQLCEIAIAFPGMAGRPDFDRAEVQERLDVNRKIVSMIVPELAWRKLLE